MKSMMNLRPIHRLLAIAAVFFGPMFAYAQPAQEATGLGHPQLFVTPYLWLAGVYATTATPLERAPQVNSSVGPFEMLGDLKGVAVIGAAEIRDGPFSLMGDVLHV